MNSNINQTQTAILRFVKNMNNHDSQKKFSLDDKVLSIKYKETGTLGTLFYLLFLIILPIFILINNLLFEDDNVVSGLIIILLILFVYQLKKIIVGENNLEINFDRKSIRLETRNVLFKRIIRNKEIKFSDIKKNELKQQSIFHKYNSSKWLRLYLTNNFDKQYIIMDFSINNDEDFMAKDVKNIIDSIIRDNGR